MRVRASVGLVLLAACAHDAAPPVAAQTLPVAQPVAQRRAPTEIEPSLPSASCALGGSTMSFVSESITLCGAPHAACFGDVAVGVWGAPELVSLVVAPSLDALLVARRAGVTVSGIIDGRAIAPHTAGVELVEGWFVPRDAPIALRAVHGEAATIVVRTSDDVTPAKPLVEDFACARLTTDAPMFYEDDVVRAAALGPSSNPVWAPQGMIEVRATAHGPVVATLSATGQQSTTYARDGSRVRALVPVSGGWIVGWFDGASFTKRVSGSHRTRAPKLTQGITAIGVKCPRDVTIHVTIGSARIRAATVASGTILDPNDPAASLRTAGVTLRPTAHAAFDADEIADCDLAN